MDIQQQGFWKEQDNIQKQFIPDLNETIEKYYEVLKTATNLTSDEIKQTKLIIDDFLQSGQGHELQRRLNEESLKINNPQAYHWTNRVFLSRRDGLLPTSFAGSSLLSIDTNLVKYETIGDTEYTYQQIYQAALTIEAIYQQYQNIIEGKFQQEYLAQTIPLCMSQYRNMFSTRIPQQKMDTNYFPFPNIPKNFLISIEDQLYIIKVVEEDSNKMVAFEQILKQLENVILMNKKDKNKSFPIGVYSSFNRDLWTKVYSQLENDADNNNYLKLIRESLSIISLETDEVDNDLDKQLLFNRTYKLGHNRWYDKQMSFVIHSKSFNNRLMYEHSQGDGIVAVNIGTQLYADIDSKINNVLNFDFGKLKNVQSQTSYPIKIQWKNTEKIINQEEFNKNKELNLNFVSEACSIKHDSDDFDLKFYKKNNINIYPFFLACLGISHFTVHQKFVQIIQTAHTRQFKEGRIEWVRQVTEEYKALITKFDQQKLKNPQYRSEFRQLYTDFESKFTEIMKGALFGHGIDRHLNALKYQLRENEKCQLFEDKSYEKFMTTQIFFTAMPPIKQQIKNRKDYGTYISVPYIKEQYKFDILPFLNQKKLVIMISWHKSNLISNKPKEFISEFFKVKAFLDEILAEEQTQTAIQPKL